MIRDQESINRRKEVKGTKELLEEKGSED